MSSTALSAEALAQQLRELRLHGRPGSSLTQRQLGRVLGVRDTLISGWENSKSQVLPPEDRLDAYARFFAARGPGDRLPEPPELTADERIEFENLKAKLLGLRREAHAQQSGGEAAATESTALGGPWHFADAKPVTIVCGALPTEQVLQSNSPDDPKQAFGRFYSFADLDALVNLHGHIRAANPSVEVRLRTNDELERDDFTNHLVLLGGVDWLRHRRLHRLFKALPVQQFSQELTGGAWDAGFAAKVASSAPTEDPNRRDTRPENEAEALRPIRGDQQELLADVGLFVRMPNPLNHKRTFTWCTAVDSRGVLGVVRALTDPRFRDRNAAFLQERFPDTEEVSLLFHIDVVGDGPITPDWTESELRLPEAADSDA